MKVNLFYLSCDCCIHCPATRAPYVVLQFCDMRETCYLRCLLHDLRHVLFMSVDLLASSCIKIHSAHTFCSNNILCFLFHLISSLSLFETRNSDVDFDVWDLHLSDAFLELSLFLYDLCLPLPLPL